MKIDKKTTARRVRFPLDSNMVQVLDIQSVQNKGLWYSPDDLNSFRNLARSTCDVVMEEGASRALDVISSKHCNQSAMDYWSRHGQSSRGFESFANPNLGMERHRQRLRCIRSVLIAQTVTLQQAEAGMEMDAEKFIAFVSSKESVVAKKFAFMMGKADENAVHNPETIQQESSVESAPSA